MIRLKLEGADMRGPFEPRFSELPAHIPIFPLAGALLLPGGRLPLNIFEPRYLAMVRDAMASPLRLIGMIQPHDQLSNEGEDTPSESQDQNAFYQIGCAGRISTFDESDDGRILITLSGCARFTYQRHRRLEEGYLMADIDWQGFASDLKPDTHKIDRVHLLDVLRHYFDVMGFKADWDHIENCEDERLISTLSMICPFGIAEKQALLEAPELEQRSQLLIAIMEMASHGESDDAAPRH